VNYSEVEPGVIAAFQSVDGTKAPVDGTVRLRPVYSADDRRVKKCGLEVRGDQRL